MKIISHRGYWKTNEEKNTHVAFKRSFDFDFGTETDIRDVDQRLVISHDMPKHDAMGFQDFLDQVGTKSLLLALNIKSDGLAESISHAMKDYDRHSWFVFDMAIPDMREHKKFGNPIFARFSEVEKPDGWANEVDGYWLDAFEDDNWYQLEMLTKLLSSGKRVCVVSPELHRRPHLDVWEKLLPLRSHVGLILCTDYPEAARDFFFEPTSSICLNA